MAETKKKKTAAKKPNATKPKATKAKTASTEMRSFKKSDNPQPFFEFRFTAQTVYWTIISLFVLALGIWVLYLNMKVQQIYDQIEMNGVTIITPKQESAE